MTPDAAGLLRLRELKGEPAEMAALQAVLEAAPRYYEAVTGGPPGPAAAQSTFTALPPGRSYADKRVFGLYAGDAMIGVADVVRGWNSPEKSIIGLLLLATLVLRAIAEWPEIATVRVAVVRSNPGALAFWRRLGFRETGEERPATPPFVSDVVVLERPLARDGAAG
jgi:hypothetical protein